jgi:methionyl-tRNA formyltransferase
LQGGVGILTEAMLAVPSVGFLNVHPGRLPQYRGNMCPERAILNGDAVWATAHIIDGGIDTGPVVAAKRYEVDRKAGYHAFRAAVMAEAIALLASAPDPRRVAQAQPSEGAAYWPPLTDDEFVQVCHWFQG